MPLMRCRVVCALFDVMLILQNQQTDSLQLAGLGVSPRYAHTSTSKFDLTFNFHEAHGAITGAIEFRTALFHPSRIARMSAHLLALLRDAVSRPEVPIGTLGLLSADERDRVLHGWNATARA